MLDKDRGGEEKRRVCIYIYTYIKRVEKNKIKEGGRGRVERHWLVDTDAGKGSRKCPLVRGIYM